MEWPAWAKAALVLTDKGVVGRHEFAPVKPATYFEVRVSLGLPENKLFLPYPSLRY